MGCGRCIIYSIFRINFLRNAISMYKCFILFVFVFKKFYIYFHDLSFNVNPFRYLFDAPSITDTVHTIKQKIYLIKIHTIFACVYKYINLKYTIFCTYIRFLSLILIIENNTMPNGIIYLEIMLLVEITKKVND